MKSTELEQSISREPEEAMGDSSWRFLPVKDEYTHLLNSHAVTTGFLFFFFGGGGNLLHCRDNDFPFLEPLPVVAHLCGH